MMLNPVPSASRYKISHFLLSSVLLPAKSLALNLRFLFIGTPIVRACYPPKRFDHGMIIVDDDGDHSGDDFDPRSAVILKEEEDDDDNGGGPDDCLDAYYTFAEMSKRNHKDGNFQNPSKIHFLGTFDDSSDVGKTASDKIGDELIENSDGAMVTHHSDVALQSFISTSNNRRGMYKQTHDKNLPEVERIYRILSKFHGHIPKLELALHDCDISLKTSLVERVLKRCGDAGNLAFRFFIWVSKQPGYYHSFDTYKLMIKILGKMRQFDTVWSLLEEMRRENPHLVTSETFVILMRRFASARMVRKAIEVLDEMPKFGCQPDDHTFGCLLDALCKNNHVKEAALLFEDMKFRFSPGLKHYTCLLNGWCKSGKLMEAKHVLVQMKEAGFTPDIVVYNTLLSGYGVLGKIEDGCELLREMRSKGCSPNAASYTVLIQSLCMSGKMEAAMRLFTEMVRSDCVADVVTYTTLISGFCKAGKPDDAYDLLHRMSENGCRPNHNTYLPILLAHEKKEELEECHELVSNMRRSGCLPDLSIYNPVIRLACKLGQVDEAMSMWNEMETTGFSPGTDTFIILIHGLLEHGSLLEACKYFKEMVKRGLMCVPQYGTLKELLNTLLREDKLELASDAWETIKSSGVNLNVFSYTIWVQALFAHGHVKDACSRCIEMMDAGFLPQPDTFAKLMTGLRKLYNREIAYVLTMKAKQMASDRNISFKSYKRRGERFKLDQQKPKREVKMKKRHRPRRHSVDTR